MKLNWWIFLLALPFLGFQSTKTDFSGKWKLDLEKSVNLPGSFRSVESYVAEIRQRQDSLIFSATMEGNGQSVSFPVFQYLMNGVETHRADSLRGSFRWSKGKFSKDGKKIQIETRALLIQPDRARVEFTQNEEWKLVDENTMVMSISQNFKDRDTVRNEQRIYRKAK